MSKQPDHNKNEALAEIVDLATRHKISADDIASALGYSTTATARGDKQKSVMSRLFSYIGAALIFTGLCVFVSMFWDDFSSPFRVLITFGTGVGLFIAAMGCAKNANRQALVTPLILASAIFEPAGIFVFFNEYPLLPDNFDYIALAVTGALLCQYGLSFISVKRDLLASLAMVFGGGFFIAAVQLLDIMSNTTIITILGFSYLCLATAIREKISVRHCGLWHAVGGLLLLFGMYEIVHNTWYEATILGLCAALVYLSIVAKSRDLLIISMLGIICYIADYAYDMFADSGLFPLALMAVGGVLVGFGSLAMRIDRRFISQG